MKTISKHSYWGNKVYRAIVDRLRNRHNIEIDKHIDGMYGPISPHLGVGIWFRPVDSNKLKSILKMPAFAHDNRRDLIDSIAASETRGEGYREIGVPSLHFQIAADRCNIHLDTYGFVAIGPDGKKYYNPDLIQHIIDELKWPELIEWVKKYYPTVGGFLSNFHPIVPHSSNRYKLVLGAKTVVAKGQGWSLAIEGTVSIKGEGKVMANLEVLSF